MNIETKSKQHHLMCMEQEEYSKMHQYSSKAFSHYQNMRVMRWMAKWQEQEDGIVKNFSIIVLAQRLVSERVRKGSLYTPRGKEKPLG